MKTAYGIEPASLEDIPVKIAEIAGDVVAASTRLETALPVPAALGLAKMVRVMNCYYSNLIEGHDTRPRLIEDAQKGEFSDDSTERDRQLEALAHIQLQADIDHAHATGTLGEPYAPEYLRRLHRAFYENATDDMLTLHLDGRSERMVTGEFRDSYPKTSICREVSVGRHIPPEAEFLPRILLEFAKKFSVSGKRQVSALISAAIAHHRFAYIHPFPDGNGRVGRLASHALHLKAGVGAHGLWSVSRGLARGLGGGTEGRSQYKQRLASADAPRQGDRDGRGNLSLAMTESFVQWWLEVCLDQLDFMKSRFQLESLEERAERYLRDEGLEKATGIIREVFTRPEMRRGDASRVTGLSERTARDHLQRLEEIGLVKSRTVKGPVSLHLPPTLGNQLFPELFD